MDTQGDPISRAHHLLAVLAVLALVVAAGLAGGRTVAFSARAVDQNALEAQRQVLDAHFADLGHLAGEATIAAAGAALGLSNLVRVQAGLDDATASGDRRPASLDDEFGNQYRWSPDRPGSRFMAIARPGLAAAGGLLVLLAFAALWFTRTGMQRVARERARAEHLAQFDHLTGLANRRVFYRSISAIVTSEPGREPCNFALLTIDLDHFKALNDRFGHAAGDHALVEVARRLRAAVPAAATLTRMGGDEFSVLATGMDADAALALGNRIAASLASPYAMMDGLEARLGASVGIACAPLHGHDAEDIMRRADIALYEVKGAGRSYAALFEPVMEVRAVARAMRDDNRPYLSTAPERSTIPAHARLRPR